MAEEGKRSWLMSNSCMIKKELLKRDRHYSHVLIFAI